jgi:hypothetical protein
MIMAAIINYGIKNVEYLNVECCADCSKMWLVFPKRGGK